MARITYIQDPVTLKLVPKDQYHRREEVNGPMIMPDIEPYQSMVDGSMITSRSKHRSHLKEHGCVEVGSEPLENFTKPPPDNYDRKETIEQLKHAFEKHRR